MKNQDSKNQEEDSEFQELVDYIRENKAIYGLDKLRKGLLQQGVSYVDIKKATDLIQDEEDQKIASILGEEGEIRENNILDGNKVEMLKNKAGKFVDTLSTSVGGKQNKKLYIDVFKYGAISFLFFSVIVYFSKYLGGAYVLPRVATGLGVFSRLAMPETFLVDFGFLELLVRLVWSALLGGALTVAFLRYLAKLWPFSNWFKLQQKILVFYIIYEVIVSIVINGFISSFSGVYLIGYLIILIGIGVGAYLSSNYLSDILETKYEDQVRQFSR